MVVLFACSQPLNAQVHTRWLGRNGTAAPDVPGTSWNFFRGLALGDDGSTAIIAELQGSGVNGGNFDGIWAGTESNLSLITRLGRQAPGSTWIPAEGNRRWRSGFSDLAVGNGGHVAFSGGVLRPQTTSTNDEGIWTGRVGSNSIGYVTLQNNGVGSNEVQFTVDNRGAAINASGNTAFAGEVGVRSGFGFDGSSIRDVLWMREGGALVRVATADNSSNSGGQTIPGDSTRVWRSFERPDLNDAGVLAFRATTNSESGANNFQSGIWTGTRNNLTNVVTTGQLAAGTSENWISFSNPVINQAGDLAFGGMTRTGSNQPLGVWASRNGVVELIANTSTAVPGETSGVRFSSFGSDGIAINAAGRVAFHARLAGDGVSGLNGDALFAVDAYGQLTKVIRERRDSFVNGETRIINTFNFEGRDGFSGDAKLGTARLGFTAQYSDSRGVERVAAIADLNNVYVDSNITSAALTLSNSQGDYVTAGDLYVGQTSIAPTTPSVFTISRDVIRPTATVMATARDAFFGVGAVSNGTGIIESQGHLNLTRDLHVGVRGTALVDVMAGGELTVGGNVFIGSSGTLSIRDNANVEFYGDTFTNNGTLIVGTSANFFTGPSTTWTGNGVYDMVLVADEEVILAPGNSPGTMSVRDLELASGGTYQWELSSTLGVAGTDWDLLQADIFSVSASSGNPFLIELLDFNLNGFDRTQSYDWLIAESQGLISGFDPNSFLIDASGLQNWTGGQGSFALSLTELGGSAQGITLSYTAVPEPSSLMLMALAFGSVGLVSRRRSRS